MLAFERHPAGSTSPPAMRELVPPEAGTDLVLTLDREIQHAAERAAADAVEEFDARRRERGRARGRHRRRAGDGQRPDLRPERPHRRGPGALAQPGGHRRLRARLDPEGPDVAAAIEEGLVTAGHDGSTSSTASGSAARRFTDAYPHRPRTWSVTEIMERSSNVGTIQIAQELGPERLDRYLRASATAADRRRLPGRGSPGC
jgi:cell division protein FtsI (penicillin-binding protein 3)